MEDRAYIAPIIQATLLAAAAHDMVGLRIQAIAALAYCRW